MGPSVSMNVGSVKSATDQCFESHFCNCLDNNRRFISQNQSFGDVEIGTNQQSKVTLHIGLPKGKAEDLNN